MLASGQKRNGSGGHDRHRLGQATMHSESLLQIFSIELQFELQGGRTYGQAQTRRRQSPFFLQEEFYECSVRVR